MKILALMPAVLLASLSWSAAQVSVELVLDQEQFLLNESLPVTVRITNRSGQPLRLGQEKNWLTFSIESRDGFVPAPLAEVPVSGDLEIQSTMEAHRTVDLMPYYDLGKPGRYTLRATLRVKQWNEEFLSKPREFEIARGSKIWEQEFGVARTGGGSPEARKYTLQQANYMKRLMLYVRVTDLAEHQVFKVFPAGPLVSFSRPEAQIDRQSNLHVLFQTGARSFLYEVVTPDGELIERQTHDYAGTRPVLRTSEEGRTFVAGGARRPSATDLPPGPPPSASTNNVKTPKP
jgi:hypothetical protein